MLRVKHIEMILAAEDAVLEISSITCVIPDG